MGQGNRAGALQPGSLTHETEALFQSSPAPARASNRCRDKCNHFLEIGGCRQDRYARTAAL